MNWPTAIHAVDRTLTFTFAPTAGCTKIAVVVVKAELPFVPFVPLLPVSPFGPGVFTTTGEGHGTQQSEAEVIAGADMFNLYAS